MENVASSQIVKIVVGGRRRSGTLAYILLLSSYLQVSTFEQYRGKGTTCLRSEFDEVVEHAYAPLSVRVVTLGIEQMHHGREDRVEERYEVGAECLENRIVIENKNLVPCLKIKYK